MQQDLQLIKKKKQEIRQSRLENQSKMDQQSQISYQNQEINDALSYDFDEKDVQYIRQSMINFNLKEDQTMNHHHSDIEEEIHHQDSFESESVKSDYIEEDFEKSSSPELSSNNQNQIKSNIPKWGIHKNQKINEDQQIQKQNLEKNVPPQSQTQIQQKEQDQKIIDQISQQENTNLSSRNDEKKLQKKKDKLIGKQLIQPKAQEAPKEKKKNIDFLIDRINLLDQRQKDYLILVLDEIEKGKLHCESLRELKNLFNQKLDKYSDDQEQQTIQNQYEIPQNTQDEQIIQQDIQKQSNKNSQLNLVINDDYKQDLKIDQNIQKNSKIQNKSFEKQQKLEQPFQIENQSQKRKDQEVKEENKNSSLHLPDQEITINQLPLKQSPQKPLNQDEFEIVIRVHSNYGHNSLVGLTEIQIFDDQGKFILFYGSSIQIKNALQSNKLDLVNLLSGRFQSVDENDMWCCQFNKNVPLEIKIVLKRVKAIGGILIWNYNKSLLESNKGIKSVQIFINQNEVWEGHLKKGVGNEYQDYQTEILFNQQLKIEPINNIKKKEEKLQEFQRPQLENDSFFNKKFEDPLERSQNSTKTQSEIKSQDKNSKKDVQKNKLENLNKRKEQNENIQKQQNIKNQAEKEKKPTHQRIKSSRASKIQNAIEYDQKQQIQNKELDNQDKIKLLNKQNEGRLSIEQFQERNFEEFQKVKNEFTLKLVEDQMNKLPNQFKIQMDNSQNDCLDFMMKQGKEKSKTKSQASLKSQKPQNTQVIKSKSKYIPSLPQGKNVKIIILSNWGDQFYVGLSGIELFDDKGNQIQICSQIETSLEQNFNSSQINFNDPRTVEKIFDGVNFTQDENHTWLAGFQLSFDLPMTSRLSLIRIWNYNKSRQHVTRGIKDIQILLDDHLIFQGQIQKSTGTLFNPKDCIEWILFTEDQSILQKINSNDWLNEVIQTKELAVQKINRPPTSQQSGNKALDQKKKQYEPSQKAFIQQDYCRFQPQYLCSNRPMGSKITFYLENEDSHYIGLTSIQIFGPKGQIEIQNYETNCETIEDDPRKLSNLFNSIDKDPHGENSWLAIKTLDNTISLSISPQEITRIFIKNYQKTLKRGVKSLDITVDDLMIFQGEFESDIDISFDFKNPNKNMKQMQQKQVIMINEKQLIQGELRREAWGDDERPMTSLKR